MRNNKTTDLVLRNARPEELDEVAQLLKRAYLQYEKSLPPDSWKSYLEDIMDVRSRLSESDLIVAELNGKLAGAVTLYTDKRIPAAEGWPAGWAGIRLLGVDPAYRGHSIGRALMEECIRRCREKGITTIGLHTSELMSVAMKMYEKMGFKRATEFDFHPAPGVVVMAYRLDI
jgi:ribosomal protein S18 acetylase RimI-like enzyme